jgi:hypothetical protein
MTPIGPTYDAERLRRDTAYRYSMVDVFTAYMNGLTDDTDRTIYFMKMCREMGYAAPALNAGSYRVFEQEYESRDNGTDVFLDKEGNEVSFKSWGLSSYTSEKERVNRHKLYFFHYYMPYGWSPLNYPFKKPRPDFDEWKAKYLAKKPTEQRKETYLNWVTDDIRAFQEIGRKWATIEPLTDDIKRQIQNAAVLVERELEGVKGIEWGVFYRPLHLETFAMLWGLVEFKRFLEQEPVQTAPLPQTASSTDEQGSTARQKRKSTEIREQRIVQYVENFMSVEGLQRPEAMQRAAQKEGCSTDTVERAVGTKKRY